MKVYPPRYDDKLKFRLSLDNLTREMNWTFAARSQWIVLELLLVSEPQWVRIFLKYLNKEISQSTCVLSENCHFESSGDTRASAKAGIRLQ